MFNLNDKMAEIAFNLGLIVGTFEFQKFIEENYFNELTNKGICRRTLINYFSEEKKQKQNIMYISAMKLLRIKFIKTQNYLIMPYFLK